ncbi:hypothetical protein BS50DRAFT_499945 [Corynespora cassiicola Philippines]|uniref:Uncharacterized protein n=1 Tax=Corynespora cassiicola Philippines TaxID=1448308 RepID=A0A2T2NGI1_CORCC|nr:hypothetical protein BS50DRAFT_499945 [Corynespora cassiicola Philippines]
MKLSTVSLFKKRNPAAQVVFNRPVCTERAYRLSRTLYAIFLSLLVALSCVIIGLEAVTIAFVEDNRDTGFEYMTDGDPEPTLMAALPRKLYVTPAKLALVSAAISLCVGVGHLVFVVVDWKSGKRTQAYSFRRNTMFLHLLNAVLVLFALVSISITHKSSSHFRAEYATRKANRTPADEGMRYNIGTFDLETWACELRDVAGARMVREDYARQCDVEVAGRAVVVLLLVLGWACAGVGVWRLVSCQRGVDGERMKTEEVGLEMGKFNAI